MSLTACLPLLHNLQSSLTGHDFSLPHSLLLLSGILTISFWAWHRLAQKKNSPSLPPGPPGLPLVGNLPFLDPELHTYFTSLARTYGPVLKLRLGKKLGVVVTSPAMAREVLKDNDITFANRDVSVAAKAGMYNGRDVVWNPYGPEWRMLRKVVVHRLVSNQKLDSIYKLRQVEVLKTVEYLRVRAGSPVNVGDQIFLTVLNVITSMVWRGTVQGEERERADFRQVGKNI